MYYSNLTELPKAWSPSRLIVDSSDDTSDENETPLPELPRYSSYNNPLTHEEPENLSTYQPAPDQNMFRLSLEEGSSLGLSGPAVALVLFSSATVSFVGTYRLRVLHGSVSLLGATVQSSQVVHQIFAPHSSPIPVILALAARGESSKSLTNIPIRILFFFFHATQAARGLRAFRLLPSWKVALFESPFSEASEAVDFSKPLILLVKGQKNSGKSTFARTLVNRLISRCVSTNRHGLL